MGGGPRRRADHPRPARRPGRAAGRARADAGRRLPGSRRPAGRQRPTVTHRRRREDPPDRGQGHRGAAVAGRPAHADHRDAAARRPARGDPGGHVLGAGARGGVHRGLRRPVPAGRPADLGRRVPGRPRDERRLPADRQEGRPGAGAVPAVARLPELRPARDPRPRRTPRWSPARRTPARAGVGRRPGRRGRRDAVRRPGPGRVRPPQPQVLRLQAGHDLAERHQRPRHGARRQDRVRHGAGLPAHDRRHLRPGRRRAPRDRRVRHRLLLRPGLRPPGAAGHLLPARAGGPARPEGLADQRRTPTTAR